MAKFRIVPLNDVKADKNYRLLSQPSTPWTRNMGAVKVRVNADATVLIYDRDKRGKNIIFQVADYAKTWGLQEIV